MFDRLWKFWSLRTPTRCPCLHFTLYTRQGCHLCDEAWKCLSHWQRRYGFLLDVVDIDGDPDLQAQHGLHVPVVTVNGKVRFRGHVSPVLLRRLLDAECRARQ